MNADTTRMLYRELDHARGAGGVVSFDFDEFSAPACAGVTDGPATVGAPAHGAAESSPSPQPGRGSVVPYTIDMREADMAERRMFGGTP